MMANVSEPMRAQEGGGAPSAAEKAESPQPGATQATANEPPARPETDKPSGRDTAPVLTSAADSLVAARASAEWRVIGETVPGASHLRAGVPNQDAILYVRQSSARLPIIVSVSDGHGSDKCFRSDRGSRFAVRAGSDLLDELANGGRAALPPAEIECWARESLTAEFIKRWRAAVDVDLKREPFREEEFARMVEKDGPGARHLVEANPYLAYGATSLSFLLTPIYALYLQLGDGEMITVSDQGVVGQPLPEDARLLANETTSLSLDKAADDFRLAVHPHGEDDLPALILITTDGYYNSFATTAGFHQVGSDLIQMLREEDGFGAVNRGIKGWLEEATAAGSGDDCTLAIIVRMDALKAVPAPREVGPSIIATESSNTTTPPASETLPAPAIPHERPAAPKTA